MNLIPNKKLRLLMFSIALICLIQGTTSGSGFFPQHVSQGFSEKLRLELSPEDQFLSAFLIMINTESVKKSFQNYQRLNYDTNQKLPIEKDTMDTMIRATFKPEIIFSGEFLLNLSFMLLFDYFNSVFYSGWTEPEEGDSVFSAPSFLFHQPFVGAYEEVLFRGMLQHSLTNRYDSCEKGNFISSLIFGSIHFLNYFVLKDEGYTVQDGIFQSTNAFIVSYFVLGKLYIKNNGELEMNCAVHAWNNIILILYEFSATKEINKINLLTVNF